jgi:DNA-binding response OmpR family regulator
VEPELMSQEAPLASEREELDQTAQAAQILIVEDDEETALFLSALLADAGYSTTVAPDGRAALKSLRGATPDLVLMDLMLPGLDGYAVTERIRAEGLTSIPIIMLTAAHQETSKVRGFDAGADDFVVKPFSSSELLARVTVQLRRSHAIRSLEGHSSYLEQALELSSRRQAEIATSAEIERSLRNDLLRSVNTHLQSLCTIFDTEYRRQPPGPGREALLRVIPRLRGAALVYRAPSPLRSRVSTVPVNGFQLRSTRARLLSAAR